MNLLLIITIIVSVAVLLIVIRLWFNRIEEKTKISEELMQWLKSSNAQTDRKLSDQMNTFNSRLDKAAYVIAQVQKNIGEFSEIGRSMKELQEFLSSPKIRGNIGEQILKDLLKQYFPKDSYRLQHSFKSGEKVDAVIVTSQGLIPIDSKFPLENFRKFTKTTDLKEKQEFKKSFISDVKKHIIDISKKYIVPDEKTVDYALMYIPSENVYYEIINDDELFDFAGAKMVLPVSPMSFYAYIKAILISFEGQKIEEKAKQVMILLSAIKKDYQRTEENLLVLNKHITNAYNQSSQVNKNFQSLGQKLTSTNLLSDKETKMIE
ncbi:DNA recombination protein RmuC [Candidatus Roizmanbacteria bacterium]|nr:DNA recombination protein RmuC [Candidatus Roizmanbacteria bacterium]